MMRLAGLICLLGCSFQLVFGQQIGLRMEEVRQLEESGQFVAAISALEELLLYDENNTEAIYRIAENFRKSFQYERALPHYRKTYFLDPDSYPLSEYYLALMLKYTGNYKDADDLFSSFIRRFEPTGKYPDILEQAYVEKAGSRMALNYQGKNKFIANLLPSPFNTDFNDYAPAPLGDSLLILTSSRVKNKRHARDQRYGEGFSDQFLFTADGSKEAPELIDHLNTKFNDGSGQFSPARNMYYFTVCGYKVPYCQIYSSEWKDGGFSEPSLLPESINRPGADTKQPGISVSGDTLFFVSDRPGGYGGNDIWMSVNTGTDWGPVQNLGPAVNSSRNENTPVPVSDNLLVFASDGHQGFGGMDLFLARRRSGGDTLLSNLGNPFNSSRDDMFPVVLSDKFLWSSNRSDDFAGFNLYTSDIHSPLYFTSMISALDQDARRENALGPSRELPDEGASVATIVNTGDVDFTNLNENQKQLIDRMALGKDPAGTASLNLSPAQLESLIAKRKTELMKEDQRIQEINTSGQEEGYYQLTGTLNCQYCDEIQTIYLTAPDRPHKQLTIADSTGQFRFSHISPGTDFRVEIDSSFSGLISFSDVSLNFISDYRTIHFQPIYFDLAESAVRMESYPVLKQLAGFLNEHSGFQLEIIAHADNTGSEVYNNILTRERADAVFEALLRNGVSPLSMMIRARGSNEPVADNTTPVGRQLNRRVEFIISGNGPELSSDYSFCFTKSAMDGKELASILKEENVIVLNGLRDEERYRPFRPILIQRDTTLDPDYFECPYSPR